MNLKSIASYLWASPNTVVAIAIGLLLGARFRIFDGVLEIYGESVAKTLVRLPVPAAALTMGHAIFGRDEAALDQTRKHEHVHVAQYSRWGILFIPSYLAAFAWIHFRGGDGYFDNPFEIEAYAVDALKSHDEHPPHP